MLYRLARPALFCLDAELAHSLTLKLLHAAPGLAGGVIGVPRPVAPVSLLGLSFPNRVGLAAGLDKNAECLAAWEHMGFGFVEVGTVTPFGQPGNPKPRMFRLPEHEAIINRLGFNNQGMEAMAQRLEASRQAFTGVLGINIGKNAATTIENAADDYVACLHRLHRYADYITANISSPNTKNLRELQSETALNDLLGKLSIARDRRAQAEGRRAPMLVKIAPDIAPEQVAVIVALARSHGVDGLIASNTTIDRSAIAGHRHATETGGLSGTPVRAKAQALMTALRREAGPDYPLIGVGGIGSAADALARVHSGADLIQIYTAFIYQGPALIAAVAKALVQKR